MFGDIRRLQLPAALHDSAYTSLAASPDELRRTLVLVKGFATQAEADREAIAHCGTVANALGVSLSPPSCRVMPR